MSGFAQGYGREVDKKASRAMEEEAVTPTEKGRR